MGKVINVKFYFLQLLDFLIHHQWAFWVHPYCLSLTRSTPSSSSMTCCNPRTMLGSLLDMMFASQTHLNTPPTKSDWPHVLQPEQSGVIFIMPYCTEDTVLSLLFFSAYCGRNISPPVSVLELRNPSMQVNLLRGSGLESILGLMAIYERQGIYQTQIESHSKASSILWLKGCKVQGGSGYFPIRICCGSRQYVVFLEALCRGV